MGLDAAVFRHSSRFGDLTDLEVAPETGEVFSRSPGRSLSLSAKVIERRLGNVDEVRTIRKLVHPLLNRSDSIIETRVLYSGSHSGDVIDAAQLTQLADELAILEQDTDSRIRPFVHSLRELLVAARQEGNPIVFL